MMTRFSDLSIDEVGWSGIGEIIKSIDGYFKERKINIWFDYLTETATVRFYRKNEEVHCVKVSFGSDLAKKLADELEQAGLEDIIADYLEESADWAADQTIYYGDYDLKYLIERFNIRYVITEEKTTLLYDEEFDIDLNDFIEVLDPCELLRGERVAVTSDSVLYKIMLKLAERDKFWGVAPVEIVGDYNFYNYEELLEDYDEDKIDIGEATLYLNPDEVLSWLDGEHSSDLGWYLKDGWDIYLKVKDQFINLNDIINLEYEKLRECIKNKGILAYLKVLEEAGYEQLDLDDSEDLVYLRTIIKLFEREVNNEGGVKSSR